MVFDLVLWNEVVCMIRCPIDAIRGAVHIHPCLTVCLCLCVCLSDYPELSVSVFVCLTIPSCLLK